MGHILNSITRFINYVFLPGNKQMANIFCLSNSGKNMVNLKILLYLSWLTWICFWCFGCNPRVLHTLTDSLTHKRKHVLKMERHITDRNKIFQLGKWNPQKQFSSIQIKLSSVFKTSTIEFLKSTGDTNRYHLKSRSYYYKTVVM